MNRESYNAIAACWDASRVGFHGREREYSDVLLRGLPVPSDILDLGCGTGRPIAEYILSQGHRVTGVDQAEAMLNHAKSRYPQGTWIAGKIEDFLPSGQFAAIVCWDALFHLDRCRHEALFARFARLLHPGGRLMVAVGGSEHPAFTDTMFGQTFFYDSHPPAKVIDLLAGAGFEPVISEFMNLPTAGRDKGRYAIVARLH